MRTNCMSTVFVKGWFIVCLFMGITGCMDNFRKENGMEQGTDQASTRSVQRDSPDNWVSYNRTNASDRFSPLVSINKENVSGLKLLHTFDIPGQPNLQTGLIVVDGTMYFTADTITYAIDAATAELKWQHVRNPESQGGFNTNRGVAYWDGKIIRGSNDMHVYALDATTGALVWDVQPEVIEPGATISMAPIAWNGLVFIGNAGGDIAGVTGHLYAFDVHTGQQVWRFDVVPESSYDDWSYNDQRIPVIGGGFWTSFSLDEEKGILYVTAGNPAPDFDVELRQGNNLYTNCVIAVNARTGKMLGYNQVVKNDFHDWDVCTAPAVITTKHGKKLLASANKDGLLTVMDRSKVNPRSKGIENKLPVLFSVPITVRENVDTPLSREEYTWFKPGIGGGCEWSGAAYHPELRLIYTGTIDLGTSVLLPSLEDALNNIPALGSGWYGGTPVIDPYSEARGWFYAVDASTGQVKWNYQSPAPVWAAVTPTAGGLLFGANVEGGLYAFDAENGTILWQGNTGLLTGAGLITYAVDGKQYVAVACGYKKSVIETDLPADSKILIYGL